MESEACVSCLKSARCDQKYYHLNCDQDELVLEAWERVDRRVCRRAALFGVCLRPEVRPSSLSHGIFPSSSAGASQNTSQHVIAASSILIVFMTD